MSTNKKRILKEIKTTLKMYGYVLFIAGFIVKGVDIYRYKDNIYYHKELKLSNEELNELENKISNEIGQDVNDSDNTIVFGAVLENDNLNCYEKETIYQLSDLLNENEYLDKTEAYDGLRKLDIVYDEKADYGKDVLGVYDDYENKITIIEDNTSKETLLHELIHCTYSDDNYHKLPKFINEGMTELLTNEYFSENAFIEEKSYPYEITMVKMLCEVIGEDKVLEAYSKEDISIIEDELNKVLEIDNADELLENMNNLTASLEENKEISNEDIENVTNIFDKYYEKYDKNSIELEMYLYNKQVLKLLKTECPYLSYEYLLITNGYYVKPYFSEKLKSKYKTPFHAEFYQNIEGKNNTKIYCKNKEKESI